MASYASQTLIIGNDTIQFDPSLLAKGGRNVPAYVTFVVEENSIRLSASATPTHSRGILANVGTSVTVTGEHDIENLKMRSSSLTLNAVIFAEFFNDLD